MLLQSSQENGRALERLNRRDNTRERGAVDAAAFRVTGHRLAPGFVSAVASDADREIELAGYLSVVVVRQSYLCPAIGSCRCIDKVEGVTRR